MNRTIKLRKIKQEKGITLVALVVTIIIIIILSTITINMAFGDNGLIAQIKGTSDGAANVIAEEGIKMNDLLSKYANMMNGEADFPVNIIQGTIEFGEIIWSNRQASITVSTNTSYYIEYQVNATTEGEWIRIENNGSISELKHGDTVYARLTDGINVGDYASASILDEIPPKVEIQVAETTNTSIKVNVIASDEESGLATTDTYTYYLNNEQKASNTEASYNYTGLTAGTSYTLKVVVKDEAGNETEASIEVSTTQLYTVTYNIDSGNTQTQQFSTGESVITGLNFTPSKSGYTFVGWREDTTASSSVLSSKTMETSNMTLYAVFSQNVTVTKYNGSSSATTETKAKYYNNGNAANPSFTLSQNGLSGWTAAGWTTSTSATGSTAVSNGGSVTLSSNATYYGKYTQTITLSYSGNGNTGGSTASQTGTRYYNSAGNYSNPSFTLRSNGFTRTNYSFVNWAMGSASGTKYNAGATVTLSANTTFYATWKQTYTTSTAYISGYADMSPRHGTLVALSGTYTDYHYLNSHTLSGNAISWYGSGAQIYANCDVNLTISGDVSGGALDGWVTGKVMLYVNDSLNRNIIYKYYESNYSSYETINTTISLPAGSRCSIRVFDEADDPNMRFSYSVNITFTAVPK